MAATGPGYGGLARGGAVLDTIEHRDARLPDGIVTFLLVAYGGAEMQREALVDRAVASNGGVRFRVRNEERLAGAFARPSDAIAAAIEVELASAASLSGDRPRVAVHMGEAHTTDGMYSERVLKRAFSFHDLAHPGQILASGTTVDLLGDFPEGTSVADLGRHRLKDLGRREQVFQILHTGLPDLFPPLNSLESVPNNLPAQLTSFVGRETELAEVRRLLSSARLLTLTGSGGCGKTRLTSQVAADVADRYSDGVWWVDLSTLGDSLAVDDAAMDALGIDHTKGNTPTERVAIHIGESRTLLILDNCEHAIDGCRELAESLLAACPNLSILATSREPIGAKGESVWRVPPLSLPLRGVATTPVALTTYDAVRLFIERARKAVPEFTVNNETAPTVAQICANLDGIPLAIELAAARLGTMSVESILGGLDDRFRLLTGRSNTGIARQQTLRASVEWSHVLLEESERILLRRLSVFSGSFSTAAVEQVCAGDGIDERDALDLLGRLVERSLLMLEENGEYRLLETIRFFAAERLLDAGEVGRIRDRHLAFHLALAEGSEVSLLGAGSLTLLARLEGQRDNLRTAMEWALAKGDRETALRFGCDLYFFWTMRGHYADGQTQLRRALERTEPVSADTQTRAMLAFGWVNLAAMDVASGFGYPTLEQAAASARESGDDRVLVRTLVGLAYVDALLSPELSAARLDEAAKIARAAGDDAGLASALVVRGAITVFSDHLDDAIPVLEELEPLAHKLENRFLIGWTMLIRGAGETRKGRLAEGRQHLDVALSIAREVGEPSLEMFVVMLLADLETMEGNLDAAITLTRKSSERLRRGARGRVEAVELREAAALLARGEINQARALCADLQASLQQLPIPYFMVLLNTMQGRIRMEEGDYSSARTHMDEGLGVARFLNYPWLIGVTLNQMGRCLRAGGDTDKAEDLHHEALALQSTNGFAPNVLDSLEALGGLAIAAESYAEGTRLLGAATAGRVAIGTRRPPIEQRGFERDIEAARTGLGLEAFDIAWAEGSSLSVADAVTYASRARGERGRPSSGWSSLTPTELEVVRLVVKGGTNPAIAAQLFISRATVKTHLIHVFTKLGVSSRAELAADAARRGI